MGSWKHHGPKYCASWALIEESALGPGVRLRGAGAGGGEGRMEDSKRHILLRWVALSISNLFFCLCEKNPNFRLPGNAL